VADVLIVTALELRNPVQLLVLVKPDDLPRHCAHANSPMEGLDKSLEPPNGGLFAGSAAARNCRATVCPQRAGKYIFYIECAVYGNVITMNVSMLAAAQARQERTLSNRYVSFK